MSACRSCRPCPKLWLPVLSALVTDTVTTDPGRAVHYTLLWGLEGVVLRTVGGPGERVPFVNEARVRARLDEAELPVVAVDPGLFEGAPSRRAVWMNDLASFAETAAFCGRLGCGLVLVGALAEPGAAWDLEAAAEVLRQAGAEAEQSGLRLAVRNEAAGACATGETLAALLTRVAHPAVGAAWSPADAAEAGHDPARGLAALEEAGCPVFYVVVRDGVKEDGWVPRLPGEGAAGWDTQLERLARAGFEGPLGLAVEGEPAGKVGLRAAAALIERVRAARSAVR